MNIFKSLGHALAGLGKLVAKAFQFAAANGLTDELIQWALPLIREANAKFVDNPSRREWVVSLLSAKFPALPERVIRAAVELAYGLYRKEVEDHLK
jgi:hypothetical protein